MKLFFATLFVTAALTYGANYDQVAAYLYSSGVSNPAAEFSSGRVVMLRIGGNATIENWDVSGVPEPKPSDLLSEGEAAEVVATDPELLVVSGGTVRVMNNSERQSKWNSSGELAGIIRRNAIAANIISNSTDLGMIPADMSSAPADKKRISIRDVNKRVKEKVHGNGSSGGKKNADLIIELNSDITTYAAEGGDALDIGLASTNCPYLLP